MEDVSTVTTAQHARPGSCSSICYLEGKVIVGTADGRLECHARDFQGTWSIEASVVVSESRVVVDCVLLLLPGLVLVGCAGELSVRTIPELGSIQGGTILTRCTGAVCLQEKSLAMKASTAKSGSRGGMSSGASAQARVCAALHDHLLLLDVDDGAGDAQVGALALRSKHYARMQLAEPAIALVWRDNSLCVSHADCYVVLDATSGAEIWRVHLRTPTPRPVAIGPPAADDPNVAAAAVGLHLSSTRGGKATTKLSRGSSKKLPVRTEEETRAAMLSSGRFDGGPPTMEGGGSADAGGSSSSSDAPGTVGMSSVGILSGAEEPASSEFVLVEQMVWLSAASVKDNAKEAAAKEKADLLANGGGGGADQQPPPQPPSVASSKSNGSSSSSSALTGRWEGEQSGRCWLDVTRGIWHRAREEASPPGAGRVWASGWRVSYDHPTDEEGWQYAAEWGGTSWSAEPQKDSKVRRRKWTRQTRRPDATSGEYVLGASRLGGGTLLSLSGGQQLLYGEMGGLVSLLFDLTQLALRPSVMWGDEPPDAVTAVPPLLLAYYVKTRTLSTYHIATATQPLEEAVDARMPPLLASRGAEVVLAEDGHLTFLSGAHLDAATHAEQRRCEVMLRDALSRGGEGSTDCRELVSKWLQPTSPHPLGRLMQARAEEFAARFEPVIAAATAQLAAADALANMRSMEKRDAPENSICSNLSRASNDSESFLFPNGSNDKSLTTWEANRQIDDAVKEVQAMAAVLEESLLSHLPHLAERPHTTPVSSALLECVSEAIFEVARPTLDTLYAALCADADALYEQQMAEMRLLLPQHMGLRRELWLLPAHRRTEESISLWSPPAYMLLPASTSTLLKRFPPVCEPSLVVNRSRGASGASDGSGGGDSGRSDGAEVWPVSTTSPPPTRLSQLRSSWSDTAAGAMRLIRSVTASTVAEGIEQPFARSDSTPSPTPPGEPSSTLAGMPAREFDESAFRRLYVRSLLRALRTIQFAWRGRSCGPLGFGPYRKTIQTIRTVSESPTPVLKAECVLRALNLLALDVAAVLQAETGAEEIAADELLPLFVFVLVRARIPKLYSQARFVSDFLPKNYALGRHGYSLATLQAALQYLMETSWAAVRTAAARERQLKEEQRRRTYLENATRQSVAEKLVELCDCPYGAVHGCVMHDSSGRLLRRGDHVVRGTKARCHHGIFYGGAHGSEVLHLARGRTQRERRNSGGSRYSGGGAARAERRLGGRFPSERQYTFVTLEEFGKLEGVYLLEYKGGRTDPVDEVLQRARLELGTGGMDFFHLRCEEFCLRCKTGGPGTGGGKPTRPKELLFCQPVGGIGGNATSPTASPPISPRLRAVPGPGAAAVTTTAVGVGTTAAAAAAAGGATLPTTANGLPPYRGPSAKLVAQPNARDARSREATSEGGASSSSVDGATAAAAAPVLERSPAEDMPRMVEGATRPKKEVASMALCAGFEVYGVSMPYDEPPSQKRAKLLLLLSSRAIIYADAQGAETLRDLVVAFLDGGGYSGAGYTALRAHAQRKLAEYVQLALERSMGPLAVVESGQPLLVPMTRRLSKKLGDLLQLAFVFFDWQPSTTTTGSAHSYGAGELSHFATDVQAALTAFSHGLVFEKGAGGTTTGTATTAAASSSSSSSSRANTGSPGSPGSAASAAEEAPRTLHSMRLLAAAMHIYLDASASGSGTTPPISPAMSLSGAASSAVPPLTLAGALIDTEGGDGASNGDGQLMTDQAAPMSELVEAMLLPLRPAAPTHSFHSPVEGTRLASGASADTVRRTRGLTLGAAGSSNSVAASDSTAASLQSALQGADDAAASPDAAARPTPKSKMLDEKVISDHF